MKTMIWLSALVCMAGVAFASEVKDVSPEGVVHHTSLRDAYNARKMRKEEVVPKKTEVASEKIEIEVKFLEVDQSDFDELGLSWILSPPVGAKSQTPSQTLQLQVDLAGKNAADIVRELITRKNTDVLMAAKVVTRSGQRGVVKNVSEYNLPTSYTTEIIAITNGTTVTQKAVCIESSLVMREVGNTFEATPTWEGGMISLEYTAANVWECGWQKIPIPVTGDDGKQIEEFDDVEIEQPLFAVRRVSANRRIPDGGTVIDGGMTTEDGDGKKRTLLFIITATRVDKDGREE